MIHVRLSQTLNLQCGAFTVLVLLALTHSCRGQHHVIGPTQPIVATVGEDVVLPSLLDPVMDAFVMTVEWTRPDLNPRFVYVWRDGVELESKKHPLYKGRTSVFTDELKLGNISLKLSKVRTSDEGRYRCFIPDLNKDSIVQLVVGAASSPEVQMTKKSSGVVLQCESTGWYPEPEVFWLDAEGNLLPAGPTETVRGPDDLYTVSSRVTVEKRHSNSFTCRVQQNHINQTRETLIHVSDDFFEVQSSFVAPIIIGLAVCIVFISAAVVILWKWRQKKTNNKQDEEKKKKKSTSDDPEHQDLMRGGRNKKEEATLNQDKGRENKTLTLKPVKNSEEIPCKDLLKRENGQKYREGTDTTYVGNQREISMQGEASEKQDVKKLSSDGKESLVQKRIEEFQNPPQDTKPRGEDKELTQDTKMLKNDATVSKNIEIFSAQSCESEKKPQAESQRAQGTKKTDTSVHTVAHGHFVRS